MSKNKHKIRSNRRRKRRPRYRKVNFKSEGFHGENTGIKKAVLLDSKYATALETVLQAQEESESKWEGFGE